ncbi:DNA-binding protein [Rubellimicrobium mesophilum]|nr:DNA-binding protein [Rubellimicrobium mesophilum]
MTPPTFIDALSTGTDKIWGLRAIAQALGLSVDTTRRLASKPGVPIYQPAGRYFAVRSELNAWLRSKAG